MNIISTSALCGRDQHRSRQFLSLAAAIFLVCTVFYSGTGIGAIPFIWQLVYVPVVIAVGGAIVNAYLNDGLLVSIMITLAFPLGWALAGGIGIILGEFVYKSYVQVGLFFLSVTVISISLGVGAFVVGAGIRRVTTHIG